MRSRMTLDAETIITGTVTYISQMLEFPGGRKERSVDEITLYPGTNKSGEPETLKN